jgi:hypothetical protein
MKLTDMIIETSSLDKKEWRLINKAYEKITSAENFSDQPASDEWLEYLEKNHILNASGNDNEDLVDGLIGVLKQLGYAVVDDPDGDRFDYPSKLIFKK